MGRGGGWGQGDGGGGGGTTVDEPSVDELRAHDVGEGGGRLAAGGCWRGKERERGKGRRDGDERQAREGYGGGGWWPPSSR